MKKIENKDLNRVSAEEFADIAKRRIILIADNIRSSNNVGSLFRTADAFAIEEIWLCGITATPPQPEIHKTALGAEDTVEWTYYKDTREAVNHLHEAGYTVLAIEQCQGSTMLQDMALEKGRKYAVILGNEVKGVKQEVVDMCDGCIEIPQFGTKHSLNVSVTAGIIIWEFAKKLLVSDE